jgi:hypothetical protein
MGFHGFRNGSGPRPQVEAASLYQFRCRFATRVAHGEEIQGLLI